MTKKFRPTKEDWKFASMEEITEWSQRGFKETQARARKRGSHGMD